MVLILTQGLKLSDTVPDLQRVALGSVKKKYSHTLKKKLVAITFEFMSSPTNGMRGTQLALSTKLILLAIRSFCSYKHETSDL